MDSARMLVYELLAGHVNHVVPQMQLDWRRALALQLWCVSSSFPLHLQQSQVNCNVCSTAWRPHFRFGVAQCRMTVLGIRQRMIYTVVVQPSGLRYAC